MYIYFSYIHLQDLCDGKKNGQPHLLSGEKGGCWHREQSSR